METKLEYILTNSYKKDLISHLETHPEDIEEVIQLALADKQPYSWRASWLLWSILEKNDLRLKPHIERIIEILPHRPDEQQRELLIVLQQIDLMQHSEGKLFDICVSIWEQIAKQPSVRFNAFKLMLRIAKNHLDLAKEIGLYTESHYMEGLSENVKKSIAGMLALIDKDI